MPSWPPPTHWQAERVYRSVLQRHAGHVKMVRLYAKYLEGEYL